MGKDLTFPENLIIINVMGISEKFPKEADWLRKMESRYFGKAFHRQTNCKILGGNTNGIDKQQKRAAVGR